MTEQKKLIVPNEEEKIIQIEIERLTTFKDHPFKVQEDEEMKMLIESIEKYGILNPLIVRPLKEGVYEIVSGHRRMHASILAGFDTIPAIVREMTNDEAVIAMVDANIQREELLQSEKAFAYKMKLGAMKRQGTRSDLTLSQNETKLRSDSELSKQVGESRAQIQRYIRLTELIPDLLETVDSKKLNFTTAVDIFYIDKQVQGWLYEYICDNGFIKPNQIAELRKFISQGNMTQPLMISILNSTIQVKSPSKKVTFNEKKLTKYFPSHYSSADMERVIVSLLEKWKEDQEES